MAFLKKRGDIWYLYWTQDGRKRGRSLKTKSKTVADEFLKEFEYRRSKKELGQELDAALGALKTEYLSYCKTTKKSSTYERHEVPRVGRFIAFLESKGVRKVSEITEAYVQAYQRCTQCTSWHALRERWQQPWMNTGRLP